MGKSSASDQIMYEFTSKEFKSLLSRNAITQEKISYILASSEWNKKEKLEGYTQNGEVHVTM